MSKTPIASGTFAQVLKSHDDNTVVRVATASGIFSEIMKNECAINKSLAGSPSILNQLEAYIVGYDMQPTCTIVQRLEYAGIPFLSGDWYKPEMMPEILNQMRMALGFLRNKGIVHNDIMPNNIMRNGSKFTIIDFNSARQEGSVIEACAATCIEYRPPEGHFKRVARCSYDIYSMAIVMLELQNGTSLLRAPIAFRDMRLGPDGCSLMMAEILDESRGCLEDPWRSMLEWDPEKRVF